MMMAAAAAADWRLSSKLEGQDEIAEHFMHRRSLPVPYVSAIGNGSHSQVTLNAIGEILDRKKSVAQIMSRTVQNLNHSYENPEIPPEEHIYNLFKSTTKEEASLTKLIRVLKKFGLRESDPRLRKVVEKIKKLEEDDDDNRFFMLPKKKFMECIHPCITLISQALRNHLIIPGWDDFIGQITEIFDECRSITDGEVATYIPQLARQDPNYWGMSICTIDGQRYSFGDSKINFCLQSVSKAFNYAIVSSDLGADFVHSYVGHEPSGRLFNEICLDTNGKPHNPMINAGAIIVTSLIRNHLSLADRFEFVQKEYRKLAGGENVGFNNATFLSERNTADRNYALSYYMKENKCFPQNMQRADNDIDSKSLREELDLYFQLCSLETNCDTAAVMAATLANGGVNPLTDELCIQPRPCRDVLSLMYSCGMYDFSGKFAFQVGLPAKSGVSGVMIVVVPNLMGIALFSPRLDKMGNSSRGVAFCQKLIERFNFHNYDSLLHADTKKLDPRRRVNTRDSEHVLSLMYAVKCNDFEIVKRMHDSHMNLSVADYDGRTALHIAASEGNLRLAKFLVEKGGVELTCKDRWGRIPLDDARTFHHEDIIEYLLKAYTQRYHPNACESKEQSCDDEEELHELSSEGSEISDPNTVISYPERTNEASAARISSTTANRLSIHNEADEHAHELQLQQLNLNGVRDADL